MQKKVFPVVLTIALLFSSFMSLFSFHYLQGDARVINYAGVVRGATQRLVKQELSGYPDDDLIAKIGSILTELQTGEGPHGLSRLDDRRFQELLAQMQVDWGQLQEEIYLVRQGKGEERLFADSEAFFELADSAVSAAEEFSEKSERFAERGLFMLNGALILLLVLLYIYNARQLQRQKNLEIAEHENRRKKEHLARMAENLRAPMNDISELMYVADLQTYDLLFLNKAGMETFHVDSIEGKKCYQALQGKEAPCEYCTSHLLREGENCTWELTNPITKRHYLLKDRLVEWDGREARLEIAFDITESEREKSLLKFTLEAEKTITDCVRTLYQQSDLATAVNLVLERLGVFLSADRTYILYIRDGLMYNDYEWCGEGIVPQKDELQALPLDLIDRWVPYFERKECVVIEDLEQIREAEPAEYQVLHNQAITSLVVAPLEKNGELLGYLGVDNPPPDKIMSIGSLLQTLCYFLLLATSHAESERQLVHLSYFDRLTSFYNRNRYMEDANALSHREIPVGVVYLDVNGLKDINDQWGHEYGDKVLAECARRMRSAFEGADFYRIGGDEFVILCPGLEQELFRGKCSRLKDLFQKDPHYRAAIGAQWAASVGDLGEITAAADARMYEDKKAYYRRHPASRRYRHQSDEVLRLADAKALERELDQNHFSVCLQPRIDGGTRAAIGAEALVRYCPRPEATVLPEAFIGLLEENGLTDMVDLYVFRQVCRMLGRRMEQGGKAVPVSVNVSGLSLRQPAFAEQLTEICRSSGVAPGYLEIEITGRAQSAENLDVRAAVSALRGAGFSVAVDNFGGEWAGMSLLAEADFTALKLDRSMTGKVVSSPRTRAVVQSICGLCRSLGIQVVAVGVETEEQLAALLACGVQAVQGYLFGRPEGAEAFEKQ